MSKIIDSLINMKEDIILYIINIKEDIALDVFNSKYGTFCDLKKINIIFDLLMRIIDVLFENIRYINLKISRIITQKIMKI